MKAFYLNAENFSEMQEELDLQLEQLKIEQKDALRAELLVEEIFWRMINKGNAAQVKVKVSKKLFAGVLIQMDAEGASYNPLVEVSEWDEEDEEYYRTLILKANRQKMSWLYKNNHNVITISVGSEKNLQLKLTLAGMVGGILCGFFMKEFVAPEMIALISEDFIQPIYTMFMHALSLVIAPVIFFSVTCGIIGMSAGANVGRVGSKLIGLYLSTSVIAAIVGLTVAKIFFSGDVPQIGTIPTGAAVESYEFSLIKFIVDIIPSNLVSPIADRNLMQVIFIAVLCGIALNALGNKVKILREFFSDCNELFMRLVTMIIFFVPLIASLAMINLVTGMGVDVVLMVGTLIAAQLIGNGSMLGVYSLLIRFVGKLSPLPFLKKIPSLWAVPFATSSSAVTMPFTMNLCTKKMGVSEKISSFSIPIGVTINMDGGCIYLPLAVIMFLKMYGVEVDLNALMIIFSMNVMLSISGPAVPNASVIGIISVTTIFGVPTDIAGILFCIATICDRICTCFNVTGDVAATIALARTENFLDEKIYLS